MLPVRERKHCKTPKASFQHSGSTQNPTVALQTTETAKQTISDVRRKSLRVW